MQSLFGVWLAPSIGLRILISKKITTGSKKTMDFNLTQVLLISLKSITIYVFIVFAIRLFGKKELAQLSVVDLVFILLISNSVQNAMLSLEELRSAVREHGVETIAEVDLAVLEVDGNISVMSKDYADKTTRMRKGRKSIAKNA